MIHFSFSKFLRVGSFLLLALFSFILLAQSTKWEEELETEKPKTNGSTTTVSSNNKSWEDDLEKDLLEQEKRSKGSEGSRGTTSPVQSNNQINRSAQNLMMDASVAIDIVGAWDRNKPRGTSDRINNKLDIRTAEFGFSGAVDQWLRGKFFSRSPRRGWKILL